jgi:CRISPR-associated protein Csx17
VAALDRVLSLIERLPRDRKQGKRWRFVGLRGPVEAAMLQAAEASDDPQPALRLLDTIVTSLDRVDRNRGFREKRVSWQPLPVDWLPALFQDEAPCVEARLALALVAGFPASRPFALYRFGVEWKYDHFEHPFQAPPRWVWGPGVLSPVLSAVLLRRTLDWEAESRGDKRREEPLRFLLAVPSTDVGRWLTRALDEDLLTRWISRLALFDWRFVPPEVRALVYSVGKSAGVDAGLCLVGLLQPLFDVQPVRLSDSSSRRDLLGAKSGARTPGAARTLANLLRVGQVDAAVRFAASRYAMADAPLARTLAPWGVTDPDRLLAALLFPIRDRERAALIRRWIRPQREKGEIAYG